MSENNGVIGQGTEFCHYLGIITLTYFVEGDEWVVDVAIRGGRFLHQNINDPHEEAWLITFRADTKDEVRRAAMSWICERYKLPASIKTMTPDICREN